MSDDPTLDDAAAPHRPRIAPKETPAEEPAPDPKKEITPARRMLWAVGIGVGGYMVLKGAYGLITGDTQP